MSFEIPVLFKSITCCHIGCHISFAMSLDFYNQRLKDRNYFYCPNGHSQHFIDQTEEQKLRVEVNNLESKIEHIKSCKRRIEYSRRHWKGEVTKLKRKEV